MKSQQRPRRRNTEADQEQRRRDLIERSITGHGPEAIASRKRLANQGAQAPVATEAPAHAPGSAVGERAAVEDAAKRQEQAAALKP